MDVMAELSNAGREIEALTLGGTFKQTREKIVSLAGYDPALADERLSELLEIARGRVPFYAHLRERGGVGLGDFPVVRKPDLRARFADFIARGPGGRMEPGRYFIQPSSGSTGQAVSMLTTAQTSGLAAAIVTERMLRYLGLPERTVALNLGLHPPGVKTFSSVMLPRASVSCNLRGFNPGCADIIRDYEAIVGRFAVDIISGSSSRLIALAQYCRDHAIRLTPQAVIGSFEHMPESGRSLIEETFSCRVTMLYSTTETAMSAWECERGNMHFEDDLVLPEIIKTDGHDGADLVLTSLLSKAMPIIRYSIGDRVDGVIDCNCGLPGLAISKLIGRAHTSLVGIDGELFSPYGLLQALAAAGIPDFQIVQNEPGTVLIIAPTLSERDTAAIQRIKSQLAESFGSGKGFTLRESPGEFICTTNGKRNVVIQELDHPIGAETAGYALVNGRPHLT